ncbi:MAG: DsbA family protein [Parcubacteria group bacterium]|nr:DsbA family protein [Parcubacteria group bacterium]MCR4342709.1 DsbA family protein [Patescibacteria group bacterium]
MEIQNKKSYAIPIAVIIAGLIIGGSFFATDGNNNGKNGSSNNDGASGNIEVFEIDADDDPALGNPEAPVVFINFGDFRCQFCAQFQKEIKPLIIEKYVKTGKVKYVYRDLITMSDNSILAAGGANCAGEQGKYWDFADYMHSGGGGHDTTYTEASLLKIALSLGLEEKSFKECLSSGRYVEEVKKDTEDAIKAGADGTPTVFINGTIVSGINSFSVYESIIEEELEKIKN